MSLLTSSRANRFAKAAVLSKGLRPVGSLGSPGGVVSDSRAEAPCAIERSSRAPVDRPEDGTGTPVHRGPTTGELERYYRQLELPPS